LPPQLVVVPFSHCFGGLHPNSQLELCSKVGGVVVGCSLFSTGVRQVATGSFLRAVYHMKLPGRTSGAVVGSRGAWETLMGGVAGGKAPPRLHLPHLQARQVTVEVGVASFPTCVSAGSSLVSPLRPFTIVFGSLFMP
jgi:hypothetical protein